MHNLPTSFGMCTSEIHNFTYAPTSIGMWWDTYIASYLCGTVGMVHAVDVFSFKTTSVQAQAQQYWQWCTIQATSLTLMNGFSYLFCCTPLLPPTHSLSPTQEFTPRASSRPQRSIPQQPQPGDHSLKHPTISNHFTTSNTNWHPIFSFRVAKYMKSVDCIFFFLRMWLARSCGGNISPTSYLPWKLLPNHSS